MAYAFVFALAFVIGWSLAGVLGGWIGEGEGEEVTVEELEGLLREALKNGTLTEAEAAEILRKAALEKGGV